MEIHLITVVWGRSYVDAYLKAALPLQLCSGNLKSFENRQATYRIFTTPEDQELICQSRIYEELESMMSVEFIDITVLADQCPIAQMTEFHKQAVFDASKTNAVMIFLTPDCLISNQTFSTVLQQLDSGKRVVLVAGIRLQKEKMLPLLEKVLNQQGEKRRGLSSRELTAYSIPFLHDITKSLLWDDQQLNCHSSHLYWMLDEGNMLIRAFHLHPLVVWPENSKGTIRNSVDDDFILSACPDRRKWKIITDSDQMVVFEISDEARSQGMLSTMQCTPRNVARWASLHAGRDHLQFVRKEIYLRTTESQGSWKRVENRSNEIVQSVLFINRYKILYCELILLTVFKRLSWFVKDVSYSKKIIRKFLSKVLGERLAKLLLSKLKVVLLGK